MPARTKTVKKAFGRSFRESARIPNRTKLSTTVAAENFMFLEALVKSGRTNSMAEAVDLAIASLRRMENRTRLERATAAYFDGLTPEAQAEEHAMAHKLHSSAKGVDFDLEP